MPSKQNCGVCKEKLYKYKCPGCLVLYCSVPCFKDHKDKCEPIEAVKKNDLQNTVNIRNITPELEERLREPAFEMEEEDTEDRVPREQLDLLGQSVELKAMLNNPHLREMLISLIQTNTPSTKLDTAMQEPIFTEFADKCLAIINNNEEKTDYFEIEDL